jgi:hypothetical protein
MMGESIGIGVSAIAVPLIIAALASAAANIVKRIVKSPLAVWPPNPCPGGPPRHAGAIRQRNRGNSMPSGAHDRIFTRQ